VARRTVAAVGRDVQSRDTDVVECRLDRLLHALIDALDELRWLRRWCGLED
jgi:hypothetical protein